MKKWLSLALKFAVSGGLIWFLFRYKVDPAAVFDKLLQVEPGMLALAVAVFLVQILICSFRWQAALNAIQARLAFLKTFQLFFIGAFFNQTLPSSVGGDAVRVYKAYREGLSLAGAFNGVMLERVATVIALVVLVLATQPFFLPRVGAEEASLIVTALALFSVVVAAGLGVLMVLDRLPGSLRRWRVVRGLGHLAADARRVFLSPVNAGKLLGWSILGHANLTLGVYFLARSLDLAVSWLDCLALVPPVILITTLPISIAGWGVREGAMVVAFGFIGVAQNDATALSLLFGLTAILTSLPGGVIWLASGGRSDKVAATEGD